MSGYIELNRTGFAPFDDALSLIEDAGTAYHHTSQWIEDGWNGEKPYLDQINESIAFAAKSYLNLQEQIIELTRQRDLVVEALENCRLLAARHRKEEWAGHIIRFCKDAGLSGSPIRNDSIKESENNKAS